MQSGVEGAILQNAEVYMAVDSILAWLVSPWGKRIVGWGLMVGLGGLALYALILFGLAVFEFHAEVF